MNVCRGKVLEVKGGMIGGRHRDEGMKDEGTTEDGLREKKDEGMRSGPLQDDRTKNEWMTPQEKKG